MYIPSFNKFENQQAAVAFMQRYSFATIVTVKDGLPVATHLPFLVEEKDGVVTLKSHFARANPQAADSIDTRVLVIFTEPHAYISPKHYEKVESVPTWNYLAVHAYGTLKLLEGEERKAALLKATIQNFEAEYLKQWESLPDQYKQNMMKGITAFEIVVDDLQAKAKLSQNRSEIERKNIIAELDHSENTAESETAEYMKSLKA
ncbi:FMN-binding negative transcriptional regulator [Mucilaginibacter sp.]|uniref:FMN-binding negative transcriptional regulator n=1 Tax=Mucilaginibacter sp. TaxID=1882438 RepID=UPI00284A7B8D|nr:FMN-binding negative transcriptional regulator [Mucilaginibacter sp.]MDR3696052.1 FMN-binding negative transcriptional regulator [Mucilaginibacter sp.]